MLLRRRWDSEPVADPDECVPGNAIVTPDRIERRKALVSVTVPDARYDFPAFSPTCQESAWNQRLVFVSAVRGPRTSPC